MRNMDYKELAADLSRHERAKRLAMIDADNCPREYLEARQRAADEAAVIAGDFPEQGLGWKFVRAV